jgi:hypothetical protein
MTNWLLRFILACHIRSVQLIKPDLTNPSGLHSKKIHPYLRDWVVERISHVFYSCIIETLSIYFA